MKQNFNIPEIEEAIKERHSDFLETFGNLVDKVEADHQLAVEKMSAKVTRILTCFCDNDIIDDTIISTEGIFKRIIVSKKGYNNHIAIWIDGKNIIMQRTSIFNIANLLERDSEAKTINNTDTEDFDWLNFSNELLDYIHNEIYSRKNVAKTKIESIFAE